MKTWNFMAGMVIVAGALCARGEAPGAEKRALRVGTYDGRAIAIAYMHSAQWSAVMRDKHAEMKKAQDAGDQKKIAELKSWGQSSQKLAHMQGFSTAPVDDILATIKEKLAAVAAEAKVDVIARSTDYVGADAQAVDITDALVKQFNPDERTLKMIEGLKKHEPIGLVDAAEIKD